MERKLLNEVIRRIASEVLTNIVIYKKRASFQKKALFFITLYDVYPIIT